MPIRPIDIARKLSISTTTLRKYEEMGLVPPVCRSASGYRNYTDEHMAYFICVREMLPGFNLTIISQALKAVIHQEIAAAYWTVNKAQADLHQEKLISEKIVKRLYFDEGLKKNSPQETFTIDGISKETGIPSSTLRYWDRIGLITADRCSENNYRVFTGEHIRQALAIYALKLSAITNRHKYFVSQIREELKAFDYDDKDKMKDMARSIRQNLDSINRLQIKGIAALHHLCAQVEAKSFTSRI